MQVIGCFTCGIRTSSSEVSRPHDSWSQAVKRAASFQCRPPSHNRNVNQFRNTGTVGSTFPAGEKSLSNVSRSSPVTLRLHLVSPCTARLL